ncbi:hypothetical protein Poli38472_009946 [Pythium oligandrum]|uniref:Uncharacterized protein n=1 Tax=Pythium oligandrum TaxID=41045 RepID=A0A8K1C891_PYTOL|nr:hypothetical protein Poli38472_009946 [Pythium oligandrum]|eukprot:TMW58387.1 hypothetical protein Poli38472_009946 [Pythium oligandrum]
MKSFLANVDIRSIMPLIDITNDSCFPSAAVSRQVKQNGGEKNEGAITGNCRNKKQFYDYSNTYHRYACKAPGNKKHAFDHVIVWTTDGKVTHGSTATLGPKAAADIPKDGQRLKFVYYKNTNYSFRFAKNGEAVQNPYGKYVSLVVDSWYPLPGAIIDGLNMFDYSPAVMPIKNSVFLTKSTSLVQRDTRSLTKRA